jgi:hypothetical protein
MGTLTVKRKPYKRKAYTRKGGIHVKAAKVPSASFKVKDRGKKGRTPKAQRFYHPKVKTGWEKGMPAEKRRRLVLRAHKGDKLATARGMQALANVTTDRPTRVAARADAKYFFGKL